MGKYYFLTHHFIKNNLSKFTTWLISSVSSANTMCSFVTNHSFEMANWLLQLKSTKHYLEEGYDSRFIFDHNILSDFSFHLSYPSPQIKEEEWESSLHISKRKKGYAKKDTTTTGGARKPPWPIFFSFSIRAWVKAFCRLA